MDRFGEQREVVPLVTCLLQQIRGPGLTGKEQDFASRALLFDAYRQFDTRKFRHHNVGNEEIGCLDSCRIQSVQRTLKGTGVKAADFENCGEAGGDDFFIVHDKNTGPWCRHGIHAFWGSR